MAYLIDKTGNKHEYTRIKILESSIELDDGVFINGKISDFTIVEDTLSLLTPMQFYMSFTPLERMKIKALATSGIPSNSSLLGGSNDAIPVDPMISEFWETYQMAVSSNSMVNPNLISIREGLEYLVSPISPTPSILTESRVQEILLGINQ